MDKQKSVGLEIFRISKNTLGGFSIRLHTKPMGVDIVYQKSDFVFPETHFLAMGGTENSEWGEYYDWNPEFPDQGPKQGLILRTSGLGVQNLRMRCLILMNTPSLLSESFPLLRE